MHQHRVWHRPISVLAPAPSMAPADICAGTSTEYGTGRYLCYLLTHLKCEFNFSHRIFSFFLRPTPFYLTMYGEKITHSDTHSVVLPWTIHQHGAKASNNTQHSQEKNINAPRGIRTRDLSKQAATVLRLRPRSHWNRCVNNVNNFNAEYSFQRTE